MTALTARCQMTVVAGFCAATLTFATSAQAGPPKDPPTRCAPDAVLAGSVCMDMYEASVWQVPAVNPSGGSNKRLIAKIRKGKAKLADLQAGGAIQFGIHPIGDDYPASCPDDGQGCHDLYSVSISGVTPSAWITWFQAQQACFNAGKRLPTNAEWQGAVSGTPDPGPDDGITDCNTAGLYPAYNPTVTTGSRSNCVSRFGAYDMVGSLREWVADWVPGSTSAGSWSGSSDEQFIAGAATTGAPGALMRGGYFYGGATAGPRAVLVADPSAHAGEGVDGFRCAR